MSGFLIPISFFVKTFSYGVPVTAAEIPFLLYILLALYQAKSNGLSETVSVPVFSQRAVFFVFLTLAAQCIAIFLSSTRYETSKQNAGLIHGLLDVVLIVFTIVLSWYVVNVTVNSQKDVITFVRSLVISFVVFSALVLLPQIIAVMTPYMHGWVNLIARLFEKHWFKRDDWYFMGSYAVTMHRVNGFEAEAGYLAAQIGCVFMPPVIAAVANHFDFLESQTKQRQYHWLYSALLIWMFAVLALAKTTTGFLVIGIGLIALFWKSDHQHKVIFYFAAIAFSILAVGAYLGVGFVRNLLNQYIFQKGGTANRLGGTIGLLIAFLHHPIIGVGNNWTGSYLMDFVPKATRSNAEYYFVYRRQSYPILSNWGGWLAQFGLVVVGPVLFYIYNKLSRAIHLRRELKESQIHDRKLYVTLIDSFQIFILMYGILALLIFTWNEYYMTITFFFYVAVIRIAEKDLDKEKESL